MVERKIFGEEENIRMGLKAMDFEKYRVGYAGIGLKGGVGIV